MKFPKDMLVDISYSSVGDTGENDGKTWEVLDKKNWESKGKYEYRKTVFSFDGKAYMLSENRTGIYFTDYHFSIEDIKDEKECPEVVKKEITKFVWEIKK